MLNTNKIQVKCLSVVFRSIPLRLHPDIFHIAPTFELDMAVHPLHLYNSIIQFIGGNKAKKFNSLLKNIIEMKIFSRYIYCVSTPFILVFIVTFNLFIFKDLLPCW